LRGIEGLGREEKEMSGYKSMDLRKVVMPEFVFGKDARLLAGNYARNLGARRVLVVTDPGVVEAGWAEEICGNLQEKGLSYHVFSKVQPNPRDSNVHEGTEVYAREECDAILALGGGSPIDCAKGIGIVARNGGDICEYEGVDRVGTPIPPIICVPTTSGSSADVSQFSIILDTPRRIKIAIISKMIVPDIALIDPLPLTSMDPYLTACTAMDALTHAMEAYVSNAQSSVTDVHALQAIREITGHVIAAMKEPRNLDELYHLMSGSMHAGLAFSNASLGAVHALAHSLGGMYDLPHGECNAILLELVIRMNAPYAKERYRDMASVIGIVGPNTSEDAAMEGLVRYLRELREALGIAENFKGAGIRREDIPKLAENALNDPCMATNPVLPDIKELESIYERIL